MALKGNLRDFSITQLLHLINLAHKSGTLIIENSKETIYVSFKNGKLAFAEIAQDDNSLPTILYKANKFSPTQYRTLRAHGASLEERELARHLVNAGHVSREDIFLALQNHFVQILNLLYSWPDGLFLFKEDQLPGNGKILTKIDLENIIIAGSRTLTEIEKLQDEIPNLDMALKFSERPEANLGVVSLSKREWKVVSYINPRNTLKQIAQATQLGDLEIRRIVYGLIQAGLVEILRPENYQTPLRTTGAFANASKEEKKSLINRIIGRIRNL